MSGTDLDIDDAALAGLSEKDIADIVESIDPDNQLLHPRDRLPPQTSRGPSGPYDRPHLLKYLKDEAEQAEDREDTVPFVKKTRGKVYVAPEERQKAFLMPLVPAAEESKTKGKSKVSTALAKELDDLFDGVDDDDLALLASELGLDDVTEFVDRSKSPSSQPTAGVDATPLMRVPSPHLYHRAAPVEQFPEEVRQEINIAEALVCIQKDDSSLRHLNLNNHSDLTPDVLSQLFEALADNTRLRKLELANVKLGDTEAELLGNSLKTNLGLRMLNLESNRLSAKGIKSLLRALEDNPMLEELKLANQNSALGAGVEMDIAKQLEHNTTLRKFGMTFRSNGPRLLADRYLMRNNDIARKKRLMEASSDPYD